MRTEMISIIVPVYKAEVFLKPCVHSILAQTYCNLEVILVNDGSPDKSGAICDSFAKQDKRVRGINKENGGVYSARNTGLDAAHGEYIGFVDNDDTIDADMYKIMLEQVTETGADISVCGYKNYKINSERFKSVRVPYKGKISYKEFWESLVEDYTKGSQCFNPVWNKLYRSTLIKGQVVAKTTAIRFNKLYGSDDTYFNTSCFAAAKNGIVYTDITPYNFMVTNNTSSLSKDYIRMGEDAEKLIEHKREVMHSLLPTMISEIDSILNTQLYMNQFNMHNRAIISNHKPKCMMTWSEVMSIVFAPAKAVGAYYRVSAPMLKVLPPPVYRAAYKLYSRKYLKETV